MTACCVENALIFYYKYLWVRTFRLGIFIIIKDILEACQRLQPFDLKKKQNNNNKNNTQNVQSSNISWLLLGNVGKAIMGITSRLIHKKKF